MNKNFQELLTKIKNDYPLDESYTIFGHAIVNECLELLGRHSDELKQYEFDEKAGTVDACARIIKTHFEQGDPVQEQQ